MSNETPHTHEQWRHLPMHVGDTVHHMSLTDVLVRGAEQQGPSIWWHSSNVRSLLVGPSIAAQLAAQQTMMTVPLITRPTGGGAVLVGPGLVGVDIGLPSRHRLLTGDIVKDYGWLGAVWAQALRTLGIPAQSVSVSEVREASARVPPLADRELACFAALSPYEVVVGGRKLLGLSQVRRNSGVVLSSAIHVDANPADVADALPLPPDRRNRLRFHLSRCAVSLRDAAPAGANLRDLIPAFNEALSHMHEVELWPAEWEPEELRGLR